MKSMLKGFQAGLTVSLDQLLVGKAGLPPLFETNLPDWLAQNRISRNRRDARGLSMGSS
jgi:hypothetical protein